MRAIDTKYVALFEKAERFGKRWWATANGEGVLQAREVIAVADGAAWILNLVSEHFPAAIQIIDWYHAKEKLCEVGKAVHGEASRKAAVWFEQVTDCLWEGDVETVLQRMSQLRPGRKEAREVVRLALGYFDTHRERMRYQEYQARGYQIGSGVVEGACKHLIGLREKHGWHAVDNARRPSHRNTESFPPQCSLELLLGFTMPQSRLIYRRTLRAPNPRLSTVPGFCYRGRIR